MAKVNYEQMAKEIYEWCMAHDAWRDCTIYFNGKAWSNCDTWGYHGEEIGKKIGEHLYEYENKNPKTYFEYGNPDTLSMAFEGKLCTICNAYWENEVWVEWYEEFMNIFNKYGGYAEFGHHWNLTFVED